jgi:hypothetical protein
MADFPRLDLGNPEQKPLAQTCAEAPEATSVMQNGHSGQKAVAESASLANGYAEKSQKPYNKSR